MSIVKELSKNKIDVSSNADELDTRPYGIGTCIKMAEKAKSKAKSRYFEMCHVNNDDFENYVKVFFGINKGKAENKVWNEYKLWYNNLPLKCKLFCDKYQGFKIYLDSGVMDAKSLYDIEAIVDYSEDKEDNQQGLQQYYLTSFKRLMGSMQELQEIKAIDKKRFLFITGSAGCGKTQQLCHTVIDISHQANVYLFFGTDFNQIEDPLQTIAKLLNWPAHDYLQELNEDMANENRYATFIVDALNEGEGTFFWKDKLPSLKNEVERYTHIKLIVSVRTMENDDKLWDVFNSDDWEKWQFLGFQNISKCREALKKYFDAYHISEKPLDYFGYNLFSIPLFIKLFCETYYSLPYNKRKDIDLLLLYKLYLNKQNEEVSKFTDEDPQLNVATKLIYKIGEFSLEKTFCGDIPRLAAVNIANKICKNRLWSNNLYHSALRANLLMEYNTAKGGRTTFEYDKMGDYIRASVIIKEYKTDEQKFKAIIKLSEKYDDTKSHSNAKYQILHTIQAFFSVWNPDKSYWTRPEMRQGMLKSALLECLSYRTIKKDVSSLDKSIIQLLFFSNNNSLDVEYIFKHFELFASQLLDMLHKVLSSMTMVERDEKWTISVNKLLDSYSFNETINSVDINDEKDVKSYLCILCWMMSSSYPKIRNILIRNVKQTLSKYHNICVPIIEMFYNVNDLYILNGIYCSIYGVLLTNNDPLLTHNVADNIYRFYYKDQIAIPSEISVRMWTLKILEYDYYLNPADDYWNESQPPYKAQDNVFNYPADEDFLNNNYFGNGSGASKLYMSLYAWDFKRYIIGTNSKSMSSTFIDHGKGVNLKKITNAVAYRIKNVYKYSNALSDYDEHVKMETNTIRTKERIGKKYQWIALGEVKAYLSDTCQMNKNWITEEVAIVPYPWYSDRRTYFDPTFNLDDNHMILDNDLFDNLPDEKLFGLPQKEWMNSKEIVPQTNIILKDKKEKQEWVILVGYQIYKEEVNEETRESFLYYSPCLVKKNEGQVKKFSNWAKEQNFYRTRMPEKSGYYDFLWNEYPWSDSSRQFESDEEDIGIKDAPCTILLPYSAQTQEDLTDINDGDNINYTVYMPLSKMYELFELRNAERGVVRNKDNEIVAIHRNITGDALDGLVIRRSLLNNFLESEQYELFYCNFGEKQRLLNRTISTIREFSSCYQYKENGDPIAIQKLTDVTDDPVLQNSENDSKFEGINISEWLDNKDINSYFDD